MGYVKLLKNKAYFKRYQVKFKRRRQCRTNYHARRRLVAQDKNKYAARKYRFVVRFSNKDVICQLYSSDITHDICLMSAYAHELKRYGVKIGFTNYAACYATGLLLARRINAKFKLDYEGNVKSDDEDEGDEGDDSDDSDDDFGFNVGEDYNVEEHETGRRPFKAYLDVGLKATSTGSRLFGALKGMCDGGINVPHSAKRFPRPKSSGAEEWEEDPDFHRKYIFAGHVGEYMTKLQDEDEEAYTKQFSGHIKLGIEPDHLEEMWTKCHAGIRKDPHVKRGPLELGKYKTREKPRDKDYKYTNVKYNQRKLTIKERKAKIKAKLLARGLKTLPPFDAFDSTKTGEWNAHYPDTNEKADE